MLDFEKECNYSEDEMKLEFRGHSYKAVNTREDEAGVCLKCSLFVPCFCNMFRCSPNRRKDGKDVYWRETLLSKIKTL